ncbi:MBL fold metallo-hydrolase [Pusillimonas sp. ANT_WB101]|uniref:MBL fold metallo-hydrolase n=1 Tax=Pusillimonas sp. ANT_WB101 TaxID=2597356 RepID=UPI0011EF64A2|nr:MBL fold metallo-hydrolase [Pusillimonas sp. ANT_WB101]KAA0890905.1 MBL fold metallo-hydrolase [Pusillimonas sp. ANT_WB101]
MRKIMSVQHHTLVEGNSLSFKGGFFGFSAVVLIRVTGHPPILFDTGHHSTRLLLLDSLREQGLAPEDIGSVFLSHLHFDHINNVDLFPSAKIYLGAAEWEYAQRPTDDDIFCSQGMNEYLKGRELNLLSEFEGELVPGLFFRHAPGHTPGSYLLYYINAAGKNVVLAGDSCKTYRELALTEAANQFDPKARSSETLQWIAGNADIVVPGHHPELRRTEAGWVWDDPSRIELIIR